MSIEAHVFVIRELIRQTNIRLWHENDTALSLFVRIYSKQNWRNKFNVKLSNARFNNILSSRRQIVQVMVFPFFFLLWYENHSYINISVLEHKQLMREPKQSKERSEKYMSQLQHLKFFSFSPSYCFWRSRSHSRCQTLVLCIPLPHRYLFVFFG